jgi:prophage antirepressor-like protein
MQALQVFNFKGTEVRTVMHQGQSWWVASDVCGILGITNPTVAVDRLDADERAKFNLGTGADANIVNESGLYALILGSRKKAAKEFKRWLTHEVLPSIRKTGGYSVAPVSEVDRLAGMLSQAFPVIAGQIQTAQQTADDAKTLAAAAPAAALAAMNVEQADRADLRRDLMKATEALVDEALKRGFYAGNRRSAFMDVNKDLRDRFGVRDAMPSDRLRLALAYVNDRHTKLTDPNRLPFSG